MMTVGFDRGGGALSRLCDEGPRAEADAPRQRSL